MKLFPAPGIRRKAVPISAYILHGSRASSGSVSASAAPAVSFILQREARSAAAGPAPHCASSSFPVVRSSCYVVASLELHGEWPPMRLPPSVASDRPSRPSARPRPSVRHSSAPRPPTALTGVYSCGLARVVVSRISCMTKT